MSRPLFALLAGGGLLLLLAAGAARAEQLIDVSLDDRVPPGTQPQLHLSVHADIKRLELDLRRDDGKRIQLHKTNVARGSKRSFTLPQRKGRHRYRGTLAVELHGGQGGDMKLDFNAEVVASMGLVVRQHDLDLEDRQLLLRSQRPLARVDYTIIGESGQAIGSGSMQPDEPARRVELTWKQQPGEVVKIHLLAHDSDGIHEGLDLFPWHWSVPHEEVVFETGKWAILPSEAPKLDHSYELIQQGLAKYGKLLPIKLYIAGHTDTVAAAAHNQRLSTERALAIARTFRRKGFDRPIFYRGFGEHCPKVPTPDETDEPRNRRAEYVLAAEPPPVGCDAGGGRWKRL